MIFSSFKGKKDILECCDKLGVEQKKSYCHEPNLHVQGKKVCRRTHQAHNKCIKVAISHSTWRLNVRGGF